jgi:O6-methylguanine-DNA--protein-cysteine methyltransferase
MKKVKNLDKYVTGAVNTPCGWAYLIAGEAGVMACIWPLAEEDLVAWEDGHDHCHRIHEEFQKNLIILKDGRSADKRDVEKNDDAVLKQAAEALLAYFSGNFAPLVNVEIDSRNLSLWQRMVYRVVRSIPRDEVRSYKWVAVVAVATPDKRCRKFRATRSPVNRARPCPLICAMTLPGASSLPSAISCSNLTSGSRQRKVRLAAGIPARMPCALL